MHTPWPGAQEAVQYLLVQCGTPAPDGYDGVQRITVPIRRLAALSTTQLPHLELLDALENLVAVSDIEMVHSPGVNQRFAAGKIAEIGHGAGVNLELVLELETDVVMTVASAQSQYNAHPVLQQAGVAVAINAEYTEPSLLGRTEWLKFTAAFFNAEALAERRFADIVAQYQQYAALVQDVPTDQRPTVFGGSLWRDTWHVAGGKSYAAQLVAAAGGAYLWADDDSGGSLPLDFEAVYEKAHAADIWLTMRNEWHSLAEVQAADERYAAFAAFQQRPSVQRQRPAQRTRRQRLLGKRPCRTPYRVGRFHKNPVSRPPAGPCVQVLSETGLKTPWHLLPLLLHGPGWVRAGDFSSGWLRPYSAFLHSA